MGTSQEKPTCLSIIICDAIIRDELTKKLVIVGTFNNIGGSQLPIRLEQMCVLFTLTNGQGVYDLSLCVEHEKTGVQVLEMRGPLEIKDPLAIADFHVVLRHLEFSAEGKYWLVLKVGEEIIMQRPFTVTLAKREEGKDA